MSIFGSLNLFSGLIGASASSNRLAFDVTFNAMQKTVVGRLNNEIDEINQRIDSSDEVAALQKESEKISADLPRVEAYRFMNEGNIDRFSQAEIDLSEAITLLDSDAASLTAEQAAVVNAAIDRVLEQLDAVQVVALPEIVDGINVLAIRDLANTVRDLTAVGGAVDAAGTEVPTNDNRPLLDALSALQSATVAQNSVSENAVELANNFAIDMRTELVGIEADFTRIQQIDVRQRAEEIQAARAEYANLLQAISLSFEANQNFADFIGKGLQETRPEPGSVLNLFT